MLSFGKRRFLSQRSSIFKSLFKAVSARMVHGESPVQSALSHLKDIAVTPDQPEAYKEAAKIYNPNYAYEQPAFVAFPRNVDDIKRCLRVAKDTGTPLAIKSGGHCFAGYSTIDSQGFVVSYKNINNVTLHNNMVTVESGASWGDVYSKLEGSDYVAVGGCVPAVGIGGYILGGGYSMLSRAYGGLACDKAVSYTMVTVDGDNVVKASENENEDLFWALKGGGGGNFGALVNVTLKVSPRPRQFVWTRLIYDDNESCEKGLIAVGANLKLLPKELNLDMAIHGFFGKRVLTLDAVYSDHHENKVLEALKSLHPTTTDPPRRYTSYLQFVNEYSKRHGFVHYEVEPIYIKGAMIKSLHPDLAKFFATLEIPSECLIEFVHMGGDIQQFSPTSTAFPHRSAEYSFYTYGRFIDPEHKEEVHSFATSTYDAVKKSGCAVGSYVNYIERHLKNWADEYYGVNYKRLCEVKSKWNPVGKGSLHFEQEIGSTWQPKD
ncbi:uncharacterized protein LOC116298900 [Actinia tenebrosa]|uniref:Uncharacterized protein LOC116298900 n=1 Tax=Actinia tenebrosa TaxID=6105 RepID=A0A6P8I7V3_ACTTE|nr:uncharacterized protein LOC116298900 [Actinia tenebrosa]